MSEVIRWNDQFYILASSSLAENRVEVLKHGETFAVFDRYGDIHQVIPGPQGLYHEGTRFLSQFELTLGTHRPLLLSTSVKEDNALLTVDLTNPDLTSDAHELVPRGTLHLCRTRFLWNGTCHERIRIHNYGNSEFPLAIRIAVDADYADLFEARGQQREHRGQRLQTLYSGEELVLGYEGLDHVVRRTHVRCWPKPDHVAVGGLILESFVAPRNDISWELAIACESEPRHSQVFISYDQARTESECALKAARERDCHIYTSNEHFNDWLNRSLADLDMLTTETPNGPYPYAGVPWFSTPFGRDGLITAMEMLWVKPALARGVLEFLASTQATKNIPERDAEIGKILHETRRGEMAALGEIPFGSYYGSVDATPLFVMLANAYYVRSGDLEFITAIWPNI